jgi:hypothetical protein
MLGLGVDESYTVATARTLQELNALAASGVGVNVNVGRVFTANAPEGGAVFRMEIPQIA